MNQKLKLSIIVFLVSLGFQAQNWGNGERIKGNGKMITVSKTTAEYDEVSVGGSFDVVLVKGKEGAISIEGEENIIPFLDIEVKNGSLQIKYKRNANINTTKSMTITVPVTKISKVFLGGSGSISNQYVLKNSDFSASLGGSGNIKLSIETTTTNVNIGGSGNVDLTGTTNEFICSVAGSGNVDAYGLTAQETNATIAGSGNIKTTVTKKIKAKVVGSGNIYYSGNPAEKEVKSVGSGKIINQD